MLFDDDRILFFDNHSIESAENVTLALNPPVKRGGCIMVEREWETHHAWASCVLCWQGEYRLYHRAVIEDNRIVVAFHTSKDGVTWERPDLGAVSYKGSKSNNLCDLGKERPNEHTVFVDPIAPDEERFKLILNDGHGIGYMTSPDGIRFKRVDGHLLQFFLDNHMTAFYDARVKKYRIYTRGWDRSRSPRDSGMGCARVVILAENDKLTCPMPFDADAPDQHPGGEPQKSADGKVHPYLRKVNKELPTCLRCDELDAPETDLYQAAAVQYLPEAYLAFPSIYYSYPWPPEGFVNDGVLDLQFAASRDGLNWQRDFRQTYVGLDLPDGAASKQMHMLTGMVPNGPRISQYRYGSRFTHGENRIESSTRVDHSIALGDAMILRVEQRMDGFVSADSAYTGGSLVTKPFVLKSKELKINIDTSASGVAHAALLDESGAEIPGFKLEESDRIQGNDVSYTLSWGGKSSISKLVGKKVKLLLKSRSSKLFAVYP